MNNFIHRALVAKKTILFSLALLIGTTMAGATDYYKISSFPIDGETIRDTFLIVVEYAGNTYIWDGQNHSGKNYVCLENYSSDVISGDYADNEVAIVHNQWHSYYQLFSVLAKGDGDRDDKGGYYVGGVKGTNGISFSAGQVNAEIEFDAAEGIKIATKSGVGIFRYNITPNDPHGFKFYEHDINMLYPTLYVKGANFRYIDEFPTPQGILPTTNDQHPTTYKFFHDGQIFIQHSDGRIFNILGTEIK